MFVSFGRFRVIKTVESVSEFINEEFLKIDFSPWKIREEIGVQNSIFVELDSECILLKKGDLHKSLKSIMDAARKLGFSLIGEVHIVDEFIQYKITVKDIMVGIEPYPMSFTY